MSVRHLVSLRTHAESRQDSTVVRCVSSCRSSKPYRVPGKMRRQVARESSFRQSASRSRCSEGEMRAVCPGLCKVGLASVKNFPSGWASQPGRRCLGTMMLTVKRWLLLGEPAGGLVNRLFVGVLRVVSNQAVHLNGIQTLAAVQKCQFDHKCRSDDISILTLSQLHAGFDCATRCQQIIDE